MDGLKVVRKQKPAQVPSWQDLEFDRYNLRFLRFFRVVGRRSG